MTFSERIKEFNDTFEATGNVYQAGLLIPDVVDDEYFESQKPVQEFYKRKTYERKTEVDSNRLKKRLSELAKTNVPKNPILSYNKRKKDYIEENKDSVLNELKNELNKQEDLNEAEFNKNETEIENKKNSEFEKNYKDALLEYEKFFDPPEEWLNEKFKDYHDKIVKKWGGCYIATGSSVSVQKTSDGINRYTITMIADNMSTFIDYFLYKISVTSAGNLSKRTKTDKQLEEEYAQNTCALAFIQAACLFNVCLDAKEVLVSCYINYVDPSTGNEEGRYLYSVIVPRKLMKRFKMENLNTVAALMSLEGRANIEKERVIYFIDPIEWNLDTQTKKEDEAVEELNIDFRRLNIDLSLPEEFEVAANHMKEKIDSAKQIFKDKLMEFEIITDEFDADNYVDGLCNLVIALTLLKFNESLFESENFQLLSDELETIFNNNKYAKGEIKKLIDYDIIPRLKNGGDNIPINPVIYSILHSIFENNE